MPLYKVYIYDHLTGLVEAPTQLRAEEMTSDYTQEDWNEIDARKYLVPDGIDYYGYIESMLSTHVDWFLPDGWTIEEHRKEQARLKAERVERRRLFQEAKLKEAKRAK